MAIKRPQAIDAAPVRAGAQRSDGRAATFLSPRGMGEARGKKVAAQPLRQGDRGASRLVAGSRIDETASSRAGRPQGKVMRPRDHARAGVAEREIANLAQGKTPRISSRKMQSPPLFGSMISAGLSHRRGNSAFTASLTADRAGHHPTDDEADDSIPDGFPNNLRPSRGKILKRLQPVLGARPRRRLCAAVKICLSLGTWPPALTPAP
jgi:hypothetical protein